MKAEPNSPEFLEHLDRLEKTITHVERVKDNCIKLGKALVRKGEFDFGRKLIANGFLHDNSKFSGIEWDILSTHTQQDLLPFAVSDHNRNNSHHPEYWGGIENMPRLFVAEMCCDWVARSAEFGTSVHDWIQNQATQRFSFTVDSAVYAMIAEFMSLLCDQPFPAIPVKKPRKKK